MKSKTPDSGKSKKKEILRFDVEFTSDQLKKFDEMLSRCYRSRKNFSEALIMLCIDSTNGIVMLDKLGVIKN